MKLKHLFILSIFLALALMLGGCATLKANPEGQLTTLSYESKYDPNIFFDYKQNPFMPPEAVTRNKTGEEAIVYFLLNPEDTEPLMALIIVNTKDELITYGWVDGEDWIIFELNEDRTKYILFIPEVPEDKAAGV